MALPVRQQLTYWGIATAVFLLVLWVLGDVILPFILGGAIAYFLDPVADRLEKLGLTRTLATVIITFLAVLIFILTALLVLPTLIQQLVDLVETSPVLVSNFRDFLTARFPDLLDANSSLSQAIATIASMLQSKGGDLLNSVLSSAASLVNMLILLVLVPVITFYLLMDWDRMVEQVDSLLPLDYAPTLRQLFRDIDRTLASFIRGQGTVCLVLGTFYAVGLMMLGLQFGLVVGATAGALTFIPYVGALVGGTLAIGLALFQFWGDWFWIGAIAGLFFLGQFLEGNVLTPNLVGSSVGLHPVWLIFALSAFGTLFGFVGMLVAVPVAASIGVVTRFAIARYRNSLLYAGTSGRRE